MIRPRLTRPPRLVAAACAAAAILSLACCAKVPLVGGKPVLTIELTAGPMCNSCGKSEAHPLWFRVLQVTDATGLSGTRPEQIWDREAKFLGPALLNDPKTTENVIDPGTQKTFTFPRDPKAKSVVVIGNFCKTQGSCWCLVKPLQGGGGVRISAFADQFCLGERR
jgi:type VI secretion system VasD/TssJ family lipoprotein